MRSVMLVAAAALAASGVAPAAADELRVGRLTLESCVPDYGGYCGSLALPLDRARPEAGSVPVAFELYPRRAPGRSGEVLLAQEGGPGYSTTSSRDGYLRLLAPLRAERDVLLIDKRGTGKSGAIDCPALQEAAGPSEAAVAACARVLGPAAWRYRSADAADDVAEVVAALGYASAGYYGDSYGTLFGQVLAARHPALLTAAVLDGAYPVFGDPSEAGARRGPEALDLVCRRSPSCAALGGTAGARLRALLDRLRAAPVSGTAPDNNGQPRDVVADPASLFAVMGNAGNAPTTWRDLDAAGRALVDDGDGLPLLRLVAEAQGAASGGSPYGYSAGLATAVSCAETAVHFDYALPIEGRRAEVDAFLAATARDRPDLFAPFTVAEATDPRLDVLGYRGCLAWPAPPDGVAPGGALPRGASLPPVPALVLSGELDTVTSPREGRAAAALLPAAAYVEVANAGHETAIADEGVQVSPTGGDLANCVAPMARAFLASGGGAVDGSCASRLRPIRTVPRFARSWAEVAPAAPAAGNAVGPDGLRLASALAETAGDALAEFYVDQFKTGAGLRGGAFAFHPTEAGYGFDLAGLRWAEDLPVDGTVDWDQAHGTVAAHLRFSIEGHGGTVDLAWDDLAPDAVARLTGTVDGAALAAVRVAP